MDQTRPINLPDHLMGPLRSTVAAWSHAPRALDWNNRLEDRVIIQVPFHMGKAE